MQIIYDEGKRKVEDWSYLTEQFVDEGFELSEDKVDLELLRSLKRNFSTIEPVPYSDLADFLCSKHKTPVRMTPNILRRMWRAGLIRRFVTGRWRKPPGPGRGNWYGVHYMLTNDPIYVSDKRIEDFEGYFGQPKKEDIK